MVKLTKTTDGYTADDTKYLKNIKVGGWSSNWWVEGTEITRNIKYCQICFPTLKAVKADISGYDEYHEVFLSEEKEKIDSVIAELTKGFNVNERLLFKVVLNSFTKGLNFNGKIQFFSSNTRINIMLNKMDRVARYLDLIHKTYTF